METESLKDYVKRFNQVALEVEDFSDKMVVMAMMEGLRPGPLFVSYQRMFMKLYPPSKANLINISMRKNWLKPSEGGKEKMTTRGRSQIPDDLTTWMR